MSKYHAIQVSKAMQYMSSLEIIRIQQRIRKFRNCLLIKQESTTHLTIRGLH